MPGLCCRVGRGILTTDFGPRRRVQPPSGIEHGRFVGVWPTDESVFDYERRTVEEPTKGAWASDRLRWRSLQGKEQIYAPDHSPEAVFIVKYGFFGRKATQR